LSNRLLIAVIASCVDLNLLNPNELESAIVSTTGSTPKWYIVCIARSIIVGIPRGLLFFEPGFGIMTLRTGCALYSSMFLIISSSSSMANQYSRGLFQIIPSIPAVFPPLLVTTFLTARAFASKLCSKTHCNLYTSFISSFNLALTIFSCRALTFVSAFFQSTLCHPSFEEITLFLAMFECPLTIALRFAPTYNGPSFHIFFPLRVVINFTFNFIISFLFHYYYANAHPLVTLPLFMLSRVPLRARCHSESTQFRVSCSCNPDYLYGFYRCLLL